MPPNGTKNLIPITQRTEEEQKAMRRKGGINSGKTRRDKTKLKDCLEILLRNKIEIDGKKQTGAEAMCVSLFQRALAGDDKAWELFRDTVGQKPVDKVEQTNTNIVIDLGEKNDTD